jgi:hypothetical protein
MIVYQLEEWDIDDNIEHGIFSSVAKAVAAADVLVASNQVRVVDLMISGWEIDGNNVSCDSYNDLKQKELNGSQG